MKIEITKEKWQNIDFTTFKLVKKYRLTHQDTACLAMMKRPYKQRKNVVSGLYYKAGYTIEVINFRGRASVVCTKLNETQKNFYDTQD
jgi:hypothetical protein